MPAALRALEPGGTVVCAGIHMSDIPQFPYEILWGSARSARSPTSLATTATSSSRSRRRCPSRRASRTYALERANDALADLRAGAFTGAAVILP